MKRYKKKVRLWRTLWHNENVRLKKVLSLRQEHVRAGVGDDDNFHIPDDLAAPVQKVILEDEKGNDEEEEEEEEDRPDQEEAEDSLEQ